MDFHHTYRIENGKRIYGLFVMAFVYNYHYYLTPIKIYQDGMIDCVQLIDLDAFKQKVRSGQIVPYPPEGAEIVVSGRCIFKAHNMQYYLDPEDFIGEVADEIEELNGRPTSSSRCVEALKTYQKSPTSENLERLRETYEAVPYHKRKYLLGDMDLKDWPIRKLIYPDER